MGIVGSQRVRWREKENWRLQRAGGRDYWIQRSGWRARVAGRLAAWEKVLVGDCGCLCWEMVAAGTTFVCDTRMTGEWVRCPGEGETGGARACRRCCGMAEERRWVQRTRSRCAGESHCGRCCLLEMAEVEAHATCVAAVAEDVRGVVEDEWRGRRDSSVGGGEGVRGGWNASKRSPSPHPPCNKSHSASSSSSGARKTCLAAGYAVTLAICPAVECSSSVSVFVERGKREGRGEGRAADVCDGRAGLRV